MASPRNVPACWLLEKMKFLREILVCVRLALFQAVRAEIKNYTTATNRHKRHLFTCLLRAHALANACGNFKQAVNVAPIGPSLLSFLFYFTTAIWFLSATYAFQSHQKIGLFSILNFHMHLLWHFPPSLFLSRTPIPTPAAIVVTSVLRIPTA